MGLFVVYYFAYNFYKNLELEDCSFYTVANVIEIKYRKSHAWMKYQFHWKEQLINWEDPANPSNTGYYLYTDTKAIAQRRFWVQVNCENPQWHILLWKVAVPDTLKVIPANGWEKLPPGLKPYKK